MDEGRRSGPDYSNGLAFADRGALGHGDALDIRIDGEQPIRVAQHEDWHLFGVFGDRGDSARIGGFHGGAGGGRDLALGRGRLELDAGEVAAGPAAAGEPILWAQLEGRRAPTFSARLQSGQRAVTVPVDEISSLSGMVEPGDRIAQVMVLPVVRVSLQVVDTFADSARGTGGFGHTGVR